MLNLELVHNSAEALLELVNFLVELLAHFHLKLVVELLVDSDALVVLLYLEDHLFDHLFHFLDFRRDLNDIMFHLGVLEDALGAEHGAIIFAVELNLLGRVDVAIPDSGHDLAWVVDIALARVVIDAHGQCCQDRIINW